MSIAPIYNKNKSCSLFCETKKKCTRRSTIPFIMKKFVHTFFLRLSLESIMTKSICEHVFFVVFIFQFYLSRIYF